MSPARVLLIQTVLASVGGPPEDAVEADRARHAVVVSRETPLVDLVPLRLFRMEIRRWQREAKLHGGMLGPPRVKVADAEDSIDLELVPVIPAEESFEDWAFGGPLGADRFRRQLSRLLERKLGEVEQIFRLSAPQRGKLRLAGQGDIHRLLDTIEDARREFCRSRTNADRLVELQQHLRLIEIRIAEGPFEIDSLFTKTLRKLHNENQLIRRSSPL